MSTEFQEVGDQVCANEIRNPYMIKFDTLQNNIKNDIIEFCEENNRMHRIENKYIALGEILEMYLSWNGISSSYASNILSIFGHSVQCKIKE